MSQITSNAGWVHVDLWIFSPCFLEVTILMHVIRISDILCPICAARLVCFWLKGIRDRKGKMGCVLCDIAQ
jgi:hypothetical protein